ncbi:aminoacyl--tRNA ligase-related protein [Streptomyces sp. NPDC005017]|uniref:aminoacyl--tRNA ligase-related protein n=1 Tax=Streptomyces sp. NPDC005017 TaxID=3364706 RepID=UPI0036C6F5DC
MDDSLDSLVAGDWLLPATGRGLVLFTAKFESAVSRLNTAITGISPSGTAGPQWCPPVMSRSDIERAEYDQAFPHLLGDVNAMAQQGGQDGVAGDDGSGGTVLVPVTCYHVYPQLADRVIERPAHFDLAGHCYRHEATSEVGRLRSFRLREFVLVAGEAEARRWRDEWITSCAEFYAGLGLKVSVQPASDPFFGPADRLFRRSQLEQQLKYEFVADLCDGGAGMAVGSANCHKDHQGSRFGIGYRDEGAAHSACVGFGLERVVLALIRMHGDDLAAWPAFA